MKITKHPYKYNIVRIYQDQRKERTLRTFVSQTHAQEHCANPESSWKTCSKPANTNRTKQIGRWFDALFQTPRTIRG